MSKQQGVLVQNRTDVFVGKYYPAAPATSCSRWTNASTTGERSSEVTPHHMTVVKLQPLTMDGRVNGRTLRISG